jgi:hypothetical protein
MHVLGPLLFLYLCLLVRKSLVHLILCSMGSLEFFHSLRPSSSASLCSSKMKKRRNSRISATIPSSRYFTLCSRPARTCANRTKRPKARARNGNYTAGMRCGTPMRIEVYQLTSAYTCMQCILFLLCSHSRDTGISRNPVFAYMCVHRCTGAK